jgi:Rubisco Assembly chaperone C-terminal domain
MEYRLLEQGATVSANVTLYPIAAGGLWPRILPYIADPQLLLVLGERSRGPLAPYRRVGYGLPEWLASGSYIAVPGWPLLDELVRPLAVSFPTDQLDAALRKRLAGLESDSVVLIVDVGFTFVDTGALVLVRERGAVQLRSARSGGDDTPIVLAEVRMILYHQSEALVVLN